MANNNSATLKKLRTPVEKELSTIFKKASTTSVECYTNAKGSFKSKGLFIKVAKEKILDIEVKATHVSVFTKIDVSVPVGAVGYSLHKATIRCGFTHKKSSNRKSPKEKTGGQLLKACLYKISRTDFEIGYRDGGRSVKGVVITHMKVPRSVISELLQDKSKNTPIEKALRKELSPLLTT